MDVDILYGSYLEQYIQPVGDGTYEIVERVRKAGTSHRLEAHAAHRIIHLPDGICITRASYGPKENDWGHYELREDGLYRCDDNGAWDWQPTALGL